MSTRYVFFPTNIQKMTIRAFCLLLTLSFLIFASSVSGQYKEISIGAGLSNYWGDLNAPDFPSNFSNGGFAFQFGGRYIYRKYFGVRANLLFGRLSGTDSKSNIGWQQLRNLSFKSPLAELAVMGELYIFGYETFEGSSVFSPYLTTGLGVFRFDPSTKYRGDFVRLQPLGTEGQGMPGFKDKYSLISFAVLFGGGAKFKLSDKINISAEVVGRRTFTDYIDDVSDKYVSYDELRQGNGELAANLGIRWSEYLGQEEIVSPATGDQRGGAQVKDYYFISTISVNIRIGDGRGGFNRGRKVNCPKF
ncbi:MAG: outer membrane beta-barrel protein [Saprospiraceae bacterium]|nr:outer membrane beta-barrel protein [Saprospiraceae bacterium]